MLAPQVPTRRISFTPNHSLLTVPDDSASRKPSLATQAFTNHEGMGELKQAKREWMNRLEGNGPEFQDIFDSEPGLLERFSLATFVNSTMSVLKNDSHAQPGAFAHTLPGGRRRPLISTTTGQVVVRHRAQSADRIPRMKELAMHQRLMSPSFGSPNKTMGASFSNSMPARPQQELMVVTGKVDYQKLKDEQKALNARTAASDVEYQAMLQRLDQFNQEVSRKFSMMLRADHSILDPIPEFQESKMLVKVADSTYRKMGTDVPVIRTADSY